jgi:hypothetical protein
VRARPTISAVAATVSTAVIQRRTRRVSVIVVSFCSMRPRGPRITRGFEAAAPADGCRNAGEDDAARGPGADQEPESIMMPAGTEASRSPPPEP